MFVYCLSTDENGVTIKRNKYAKIGGCSSCGQGKQPMVNWAELLPPPPEHPPLSELSSPMDHSTDCTLHRHNINNSNIAETRFMDNRSPMSPVSKISACSCPAPHDRKVPHLRANIPYSDIEYPAHSGPSHRYHGDMGGSCQDGGGGGGGGGSGGGGSSGGSNYNSDRPYSPKQLNSARTQTTDALLHRCPSPRSCHNCGSSIQQSSGPQLPQSSSSSSSSYNPHIHHHHHHPLHSDSFVTVNQRPLCTGDMSDSRIGLYPQVGSVCPQGGVSASFTQTSGVQCPYNPVYPYPTTALHGYRIPPLDANEQRNAAELEQFQGRMFPPGHEGPHMDRACQSSLPSLASESMQTGYGRR